MRAELPKPSDARVAVRKKVGGRARVTLRSGANGVGKMVDISPSGACVLLDDGLPAKTQCLLHFDIYVDGKRYDFAAEAVSVYSVLSSGQGFKIGFVFGQLDTHASKTLKSLVG